MIYNLTYLLLFPKYNCWWKNGDVMEPIVNGSESYESYCKPEYFCQNLEKVGFQSNTESHLSLVNFVTKFNMDCYSGFQISLPGMVFFGGWGLSSMVLPSMADKYGRKKLLCYCLLVNLIT